MAAAAMVDFVVVGGGIAGASVGAELAAAGHSVTVLERESHPGMHASGRSAAVYMASYGNQVVRALSAASRQFLTGIDTLWDGAIVRERGALFIASADQVEQLQNFWESRRTLQPYLEMLDGSEAARMVPILNEGHVASCIYDFDTFDVDVDAMLHSYLRQLRAMGGILSVGTDFVRASPSQGGWLVETSRGPISCGAVINAAGAWADEVAIRSGVGPLGLQPFRRSAFLVSPPDKLAIDRWPIVFDIEEQFYFKPDAGLILISPANEDPSPACDAWAEEMEIAVGAHRVEEATTLSIQSVKSSWAGLRTFLPDRTPVVGEDPRARGFYWCAGQGGYGVQIGPALARCAAAAACGAAWPADVAALGITPAMLAPSRLGDLAPATEAFANA